MARLLTHDGDPGFLHFRSRHLAKRLQKVYSTMVVRVVQLQQLRPMWIRFVTALQAVWAAQAARAARAARLRIPLEFLHWPALGHVVEKLD